MSGNHSQPLGKPFGGRPLPGIERKADPLQGRGHVDEAQALQRRKHFPNRVDSVLRVQLLQSAY